MCKHVAAVLYGVGARLDERPELLFARRGTDEKEPIARAGSGMSTSARAPARGKILHGSRLSDIFGIELAEGAEPEAGGAGRGTKRKQSPAAAPSPNRKVGTAAARTASTRRRGRPGHSPRA